MEWMNRGGNAPQQASQQSANGASNAPAAHRPSASKNQIKTSKMWQAASVFLLFAGTALVVALIAYLALIKPSNAVNAAEHVDTTKYQAVFLNGGQVYFGKIKTLNDTFVRVSDIYYLRVNQQVQPNGTQTAGDVQLVKLGCELHGPQDQMVINSEQVIFWENLKEDGQVAQAVKKYVEDNPDGQKCQTASSQQNTDKTTTDDTKKPTN